MHRAIMSLAAVEPFGSVLDLGCGFGQMGLALLEAGVACSVIGIDVSDSHLNAARKAGKGLPFGASRQDLAIDRALPSVDTVLLLDVLYQLDDPAQAEVLAMAVQAARSSIVIRTMDPDRGFRSGLSRALEMLFCGIWPTSGATVNPKDVGAFVELLKASGLSVSTISCSKGTPFANVLLVGKRLLNAS